MPRVKRGTMHLKKRRKLLQTAKGFKLGRKKLIKLAKQAVIKAGQHAYVGRKKKKRNFRQLANIKINAIAHQHQLTYSELIHKLKTTQISLNRKMLAELGEKHPQVFSQLVQALKPPTTPVNIRPE